METFLFKKNTPLRGWSLPERSFGDFGMTQITEKIERKFPKAPSKVGIFTIEDTPYPQAGFREVLFEREFVDVDYGKKLPITLSVGFPHGSIKVFHNPEFEGTRTKGVGGIGVTGRLIKNIDEDAPGLRPLLEQATGKIVFLGNGYSDYPLHAVERYKRGELAEPPVILDLFDYRALKMALEELRPYMDQHGLEPPPIYNTVNKIIDEIDDGNLVAIEHLIGKGAQELPPQLSNAQLLVNVLGPSTSVLDEQVQMIGDEGIFYFTQLDSSTITQDRMPPGYGFGFLSELRACLIFKC